MRGAARVGDPGVRGGGGARELLQPGPGGRLGGGGEGVPLRQGPTPGRGRPHIPRPLELGVRGEWRARQPLAQPQRRLHRLGAAPGLRHGRQRRGPAPLRGPEGPGQALPARGEAGHHQRPGRRRVLVRAGRGRLGQGPVARGAPGQAGHQRHAAGEDGEDHHGDADRSQRLLRVRQDHRGGPRPRPRVRPGPSGPRQPGQQLLHELGAPAPAHAARGARALPGARGALVRHGGRGPRRGPAHPGGQARRRRQLGALRGRGPGNGRGGGGLRGAQDVQGPRGQGPPRVLVQPPAGRPRVRSAPPRPPRARRPPPRGAR
mmetsp:Transcript_17301/g.50299  ORF Transcript_17301/g.50299 Transcript_17301/m.50299 type:complete len:318 (-) Transcript_17301:92-1045(-)